VTVIFGPVSHLGWT